MPHFLSAYIETLTRLLNIFIFCPCSLLHHYRHVTVLSRTGRETQQGHGGMYMHLVSLVVASSWICSFDPFLTMSKHILMHFYLSLQLYSEAARGSARSKGVPCHSDAMTWFEEPDPAPAPRHDGDYTPAEYRHQVKRACVCTSIRSR